MLEPLRSWYSRPGFGKPWPVGQIQSTICFVNIYWNTATLINLRTVYGGFWAKTAYLIIADSCYL